MAETTFDVSRESAVPLTRDAFIRIREEDAVEVLPPTEPGEEALAPGHSYTSLFQAAMIAVRARVTTYRRTGQGSGIMVPQTATAVAVLRDPKVYGDPSTRDPSVGGAAERADQYAIYRATEPLLAALRERGAISTPVEWEVWACEECGQQYHGPTDHMEIRRCPNPIAHPGGHGGPLFSRYRVVPAPGETEVPESVDCGTGRFPKVVWCRYCQNGSTWDEAVDLGGQGPDGHDRTASCCPFCHEPRPGSERPLPEPTLPDPGEYERRG